MHAIFFPQQDEVNAYHHCELAAVNVACDVAGADAGANADAGAGSVVQ